MLSFFTSCNLVSVTSIFWISTGFVLTGSTTSGKELLASSVGGCFYTFCTVPTGCFASNWTFCYGCSGFFGLESILSGFSKVSSFGGFGVATGITGYYRFSSVGFAISVTFSFASRISGAGNGVFYNFSLVFVKTGDWFTQLILIWCPSSHSFQMNPRHLSLESQQSLMMLPQGNPPAAVHLSLHPYPVQLNKWLAACRWVCRHILNAKKSSARYCFIN